MEEIDVRFAYFSLQKDGNLYFNERNENIAEFVLPRHPETNALDVYYLQSMLKYFDPLKDISNNEILDAFPVLSLTRNKDNKFYKLSIHRLREFSKGSIEEDEYIQASMKHLFMYSLLANPTNTTLKRMINRCLDKVTPVMYHPESGDRIDFESYDLQYLASYVPTKTYRIMKLLRGWIEGALHFYNYSILFFDYRFVSFDNFNENIVNLRTKDFFRYFDRDPKTSKISVNFQHQFKNLNVQSELYNDIELTISDFINRKWLFTPPNNDNERDGKVMMFRNNDFKIQLEEILTCLFRKDSFRLNEVFKWNRYFSGGRFDSHYDTMFVQHSSEECSLYTLLIYLEVEGDSFMYLYGDNEVQVRLESNKAYIIPHWVKHRVEGEGAREFIKTEIVFRNKHIGITYDQTLADAFDASCYYMLQSVRHPELKDIVSQNFNAINEARFYKAVFMHKLINNIFFIKTTHNIPFEYYSINNDLIRSSDLKLNFITDGTYYYFKIKNNIDGKKPVVSHNEAIVMLSLMQLDIHPKKMFKRSMKTCPCECPPGYNYDLIRDFEIDEEIVYCEADNFQRRLTDTLQCIKLPLGIDKVYRVGNISVSDMSNDLDTFYFAACQNTYPDKVFIQSLITEITLKSRDGSYSGSNVDFIGAQKNVVKIRQHSFKNGIIATRKWLTDEIIKLR